MLPRSSCAYTAQYCEENAVLLAAELGKMAGRCCVVFISNAVKQVPIWHQKAARTHGEPVIWDYHVIVMHSSSSSAPWQVYDLDSTLPWACSAQAYVDAAFRPGFVVQKHQQCFRVVNAVECCSRFSSDRRHMLNDGGEGYLAPPPPYPPIVGPDARSDHELGAYLDFCASPRREEASLPDAHWYGRLLSLADFCLEFVTSV